MLSDLVYSSIGLFGLETSSLARENINNVIRALGTFPISQDSILNVGNMDENCIHKDRQILEALTVWDQRYHQV